MPMHTTRVGLLYDALKTAHEWYNATTADVSEEQANRVPPGRAHPIGERMAHLAQAEDTEIHAILQDGHPLAHTTWAGKVGSTGDKMHPTRESARSTKVDLKGLRAYTAAVQQASLDYVKSLKDEDLDTTRDMGEGFGVRTVAWILENILIGHVRDMMGEISALKGVQGERGYPF